MDSGESRLVGSADQRLSKLPAGTVGCGAAHRLALAAVGAGCRAGADRARAACCGLGCGVAGLRLLAAGCRLLGARGAAAWAFGVGAVGRRRTIRGHAARAVLSSCEARRRTGFAGEQARRTSLPDCCDRAAGWARRFGLGDRHRCRCPSSGAAAARGAGTPRRGASASSGMSRRRTVDGMVPSRSRRSRRPRSGSVPSGSRTSCGLSLPGTSDACRRRGRCLIGAGVARGTARRSAHRRWRCFASTASRPLAAPRRPGTCRRIELQRSTCCVARRAIRPTACRA